MTQAPINPILDGLNPRQLEAVKETVHQSALVIAGAGSGKTSVLTRRIAYLIEQGVDPLNIMAVTFTNKASSEMKERVSLMIGDVNTRKLMMGTFHKICIIMLKRYGAHIGVQSNFTISDPADQKQIMRKVLSDHGIDTTAGAVKSFLGRISDLKNKMLTPEAFYQQIASGDKEPGDEILQKIYLKYQEKLVNLNVLDFDDLLMQAVRLLDRHQPTRAYHQDRYQYLMVDEYQDTNPCQYRLIQLLSGKEKCEIPGVNNVFVVGDDSQSIYAFRGSDFRIILNFEKDFPEARTIKLEENYRSTKTIVRAGNEVIKNNKVRKDKVLFTANQNGNKIRLHQAKDNEAEAKFVADSILKEIKAGRKPDDFAVLYRANFLSREIEAQLIKNRIPYKIVGGVQFYDRAEIKDTIAYLKAIVNFKDEIAVKRVMDTFPGIGKNTIAQIENQAAVLNVSMAESLKVYEAGRKTVQNALDSLRELLRDLYMLYRVSATEENPVSKMIEMVWKRTAYKEKLEQQVTKEAFARLENLTEIEAVARHYESTAENPTLEDFLDGISLQADMAEKDDQASVTLMTVHASKGLEFKHVHVVGMEEGLFPHKMSLGSEADIEEERRLAYVAITRAEEDLTISYSKKRSSYMGTEWQKESRFLHELPSDLVEEV